MEFTKTFTKAMEIGAKFAELYSGDERTEEWHGTVQCAEMTKRVIEYLEKEQEATIDETVKLVTENMIANEDKGEDHMWDDYCRGFLAGEKLGLPTEENMAKVEKAEELWDNNEDYGYYQEVLDEVE